MSQSSAAFQADLQRRLVGFGIAPSSIPWLIKALHPACPIDGVLSGLPDDTAHASARLENRCEMVISTPAGLTTPTWDLAIWRFPGDVCPVKWVSGNAGLITTGPGLATGKCSLETYNPSPDTGYYVSVSPTYQFPTAPDVSTLNPVKGYSSWRTIFASVTAYLTASALNDQGTVFSTVLSRPARPGAFSALTGSLTPPPAGYVAYNDTEFSLPLNEEDATLLDPKIYTAPARDGAYAVHSLSGPTQPYTHRPTAGMTLALTGTPAFLGYIGEGPPAYPADSAFLTSVSTLPNRVGSGFWFGSGQPDPTWYDTAVDNTSCGLMIFRGLAPGASVTLRVIQAMELIATSSGAVRPFVRPPPAPDPKAVEAYYAVRVDLAHSYPAEWNSLGILLSALAGAAARLWPVVRSVGGALLGVAPTIAQGFRDSRAILQDARTGYAAKVGQPQPSMASQQAVVLRPSLAKKGIKSRVPVKVKAKVKKRVGRR